jgi:hypothetical protein
MSFKDTVKFDWYLDQGDGHLLLSSSDSDSNTFTISGLLSHPGDRMRLRVQIHDRDTQRAKLAFDLCGDDDWCEMPKGCYQRWTFQVNYIE